MSRVLHSSGRATPPAAGTMNNRLSGRINKPLWHWTNTIHFPSGDTFAKLLLMPLCEAPSMRSAWPPLPPLNGIR
jgi:hypothetical protein